VQTDYNLFLMTEKAKLQDTLTLKLISYTIYLTHFMKNRISTGASLIVSAV